MINPNTNTSTPFITFLELKNNMTITWDESNLDKVSALIEERISEGYIFYIINHLEFDRNDTEASAKDFSSDPKLEALVNEGSATSDPFIHDGYGTFGVYDSIKRTDIIEEILTNQSIAVRPMPRSL